MSIISPSSLHSSEDNFFYALYPIYSFLAFFLTLHIPARLFSEVFCSRHPISQLLMSDQELTDWMAATKDFTEQSSRNVKGKKESQKRIDGVERIKEIVLGAMERAGRDDAH